MDKCKHIIRQEAKRTGRGKGVHVKDKIWVRRDTLIKELQLIWDDCSYTAAQEILSLLEKEEGQRDPKAWFLKKKIGSTMYVKQLRDWAI